MFDAPTNTLSLFVVTPLSTGHSTTQGMLHAPLSVVPRAGGTRGVYDAWNKASGAVVSRGTGRAADGRSGLKGSWWANADSHCASPLPTAAGRSPLDAPLALPGPGAAASGTPLGGSARWAEGRPWSQTQARPARTGCFSFPPGILQPPPSVETNPAPPPLCE